MLLLQNNVVSLQSIAQSEIRGLTKNINDYGNKTIK